MFLRAVVVGGRRMTRGGSSCCKIHVSMVEIREMWIRRGRDWEGVRDAVDV